MAWGGDYTGGARPPKTLDDYFSDPRFPPVVTQPAPIDTTPTVGPIVTGVDPVEIHNVLYGKVIPLSALGLARIGTAGLIFGPYFKTAGKASFAVSFGFPANPAGTRKIYEVSLDSKVAWELAAGSPAGALDAAGFVGDSFTCRFYAGTQTQAADPLEIEYFADQAVAYRPQMMLWFDNLDVAQFDGKVPFVSAKIGDVTGGALPSDGINLGEALERIAYSPWLQYDSGSFEATGVTDIVGAMILTEDQSFLDLLRVSTRVYRTIDILQTDKLRINDRGASTAPDLVLNRDRIAADGGVQFSRREEASILRELELITIDPDADYVFMPSKAVRPLAPAPVTSSVAKDTITLPVVIGATTRASLVSFAKYAEDNARKRVSLQTMLAGYALEPGDLFRLDKLMLERFKLTPVDDRWYWRSTDGGFDPSEIFKVVETSHGANFINEIVGEPILKCAIYTAAVDCVYPVFESINMTSFAGSTSPINGPMVGSYWYVSSFAGATVKLGRIRAGSSFNGTVEATVDLTAVNASIVGVYGGAYNSSDGYIYFLAIVTSPSRLIALVKVDPANFTVAGTSVLVTADLTVGVTTGTVYEQNFHNVVLVNNYLYSGTYNNDNTKPHIFRVHTGTQAWAGINLFTIDGSLTRARTGLALAPDGSAIYAALAEHSSGAMTECLAVIDPSNFTTGGVTLVDLGAVTPAMFLLHYPPWCDNNYVYCFTYDAASFTEGYVVRIEHSNLSNIDTLDITSAWESFATEGDPPVAGYAFGGMQFILTTVGTATGASSDEDVRIIRVHSDFTTKDVIKLDTYLPSVGTVGDGGGLASDGTHLYVPGQGISGGSGVGFRLELCTTALSVVGGVFVSGDACCFQRYARIETATTEQNWTGLGELGFGMGGSTDASSYAKIGGVPTILLGGHCDDPNGAVIMASHDGLEWSQVFFKADFAVTDLFWNAEENRFLANVEDGTVECWVSENGIDWELTAEDFWEHVTLAGDGEPWSDGQVGYDAANDLWIYPNELELDFMDVYCVAFVNGIWMAGGQLTSTTTSATATSIDGGTTWTLVTSGAIDDSENFTVLTMMAVPLEDIES